MADADRCVLRCNLAAALALGVVAVLVSPEPASAG